MFDGLGYHWIKPFTDFLRDGQLGVNIFFVISGFLITALLLREEENTGRISVRNFYIRRTLRIFPAYYFLLSFYFILQLVDIIKLENASWLSSVTYTKYLNPGLDWLTAHAWSLSIEENFYLLWPLIFLCGGRTRKIIALALVLAVPVIQTVVHFHPVYWINDLSIFTRIDAIATGCLFAFYKNEILKFIIDRRIFYSAVILLFVLRYAQHIAATAGLGFIFIPFGLTHGSFANILIGIIMMYSVFGSEGRWHDFLNCRTMNYIGVLSYSLYLWQQIFFSEAVCLYFNYPVHLPFLLIIALISYYLVEKPFLRLKPVFTRPPEAPVTEGLANIKL
jgi:peptidoglycan/LPS O-acetylase OafA/YrhL